MKIGKNLDIFVALSAAILFFPSISFSTQVFTLNIDPEKSWVEDRYWYEKLPSDTTITDEEAIEKMELLTNFGISPTIYQYHPAQQIPISGILKVFLDRAYPAAIEVESGDDEPVSLPSGDEFALASFSRAIKDNQFPYDTPWPNLPDGAICACITAIDITAPSVSGSFNGTQLIFDYQNNMGIIYLSPAYFYDSIILGFDSDIHDNDAYRLAYHIEATVVPLPSAIFMFMSALGFILTKSKGNR